MDIDAKHPNFILFLNNVTNTIFNHVTISGYFKLTPEKKLGVQYIVLKLMNSSLKIKGRVTKDDLKTFVIILLKKNEENENYELAGILSDIHKNFNAVYENTNTKKTPTKTTKKNQPKKK